MVVAFLLLNQKRFLGCKFLLHYKKTLGLVSFYKLMPTIDHSSRNDAGSNFFGCMNSPGRDLYCSVSV